MQVPSQQTHTWRARGSPGGERQRGAPAAKGSRDAARDARGASPPAAIATAGTRSHSCHPYNSGTEDRPAPACSGGHGAAGTALAPTPCTTGTQTDMEQQQQHLFQCHSPPRTGVLAAPSPGFGYDEPGDGHTAPGVEPPNREEAHWDPWAARGGGWRGWHGHPSPGAPVILAGAPSQGCLAGSQGSRWPRAPRRRRSCPAGRSPGHRPASAAPAE